MHCDYVACGLPHVLHVRPEVKQFGEVEQPVRDSDNNLNSRGRLPSATEAEGILCQVQRHRRDRRTSRPSGSAMPPDDSKAIAYAMCLCANMNCPLTCLHACLQGFAGGAAA